MTKLVVFFLDAIRFQDMTVENTPFLARISHEGISGPLATLLAYEGLAATLFTGTFPSIHGIWTRYYADPERSPFKWVGPIARWIDHLDGGCPSRQRSSGTESCASPMRWLVSPIFQG